MYVYTYILCEYIYNIKCNKTIIKEKEGSEHGWEEDVGG